MHCNRCGICCEKTEMLLSRGDLMLLQSLGHREKEFARLNKQGLFQLRNRKGYCVFYEPEKHLCRVYKHRPQGCRIYPVIYSETQGVMVDDLCPKMDTVSAREIQHKAKKLAKLLRRIDSEAKNRRRQA